MICAWFAAFSFYMGICEAMGYADGFTFETIFGGFDCFAV